VICLVPVADIDKVWPALMDGIAEACRRCGDDVTPWHLLSWCRRSDALLFVAWDGEVKAGLVVRPEQWGAEQVLRILTATGHEIDKWLPELEASDDWQKFVGNLPVIFEGRPGWQRKIPKARVQRVVYRMEANERR
jgi:hypothetical protein